VGERGEPTVRGEGADEWVVSRATSLTPAESAGRCRAKMDGLGGREGRGE